MILALLQQIYERLVGRSEAAFDIKVPRSSMPLETGNFQDHVVQDLPGDCSNGRCQI